jgi:hypothetical protein
MRTDMEFMNRLFHWALRRDLDRMIGVLAAPTTTAPARRAALGEHLSLVLDLLHHHHTGEDEGLWPLVRRRAPDLGAQLDIMAAEHATVARAIAATRAAVRRYGDAADPAAADDVRDAIGELRAVLLPHLDHEETEVMPRVMRALSDRDWSALARREVRKRGSLALAGTGLVWLVDGLEPQRRAEFNRQVSATFRWLVDMRYGRAYRRRAALAFGPS